MIKAKKIPWSALAFVSRLILGGIFIYASLDKIIHPAQFAEIMYNYKILPTELVNVSALVMPWVELFAGVLLILGIFPLSSAAILTGLTLMFIVVLAYNLGRGLDFQCGCFTTSPDADNATFSLLIRDIFLLIPGIICLKVYIGDLGSEDTLDQLQ